MDRALTGGIGVGTSLAIGLELLRNLDQRVPLQTVSAVSDLCLHPHVAWWEIHTTSLCLGLLLGLLLGPVLEALVALRFWLYQQTLTRLGPLVGGGPTARPAFRVC